MITPDCIFHRLSGAQRPPEGLRNKIIILDQELCILFVFVLW